jgi:hypothetical protein
VIGLAAACAIAAGVTGGVSARGATPPGVVVAPTGVQLAEAAGSGMQVRWNTLGTPAVVEKTGGYIATGLPADPEAAARAYVAAHRDLLGLAPGAALQLLGNAPLGKGRALLFRQTIDGVPLAPDGLLNMAVVDGKVVYLSSTLTRTSSLSGSAALSVTAAYRVAAAAAGLDLGGAPVTAADTRTAKLVGVPTATQGVRLAYQVMVLANTASADPVADLTFVDAETGQVLDRQSLIDSETADPVWSAFRASPTLDYSSTDTRQRWCFLGLAAGCQLVVGSPASPLAWDVDPTTGSPTFTTNGNNEIAVQNWNSANPFTVGTQTATPSPTRDYTYPWTNQWFNVRCNPIAFGSPQANDIDAARANLFAMHNRMHDFSYRLGFTETTWNLQRSNFGRGEDGGDPEQGNAQAGGIVGGPPGCAARDNANQITPPDGTAPITNMYLWQPIAGSFYPPCVDGDYDMSVIGHEYTHAISNRMVAGPDMGIAGAQGGSMGESWSDLDVMEYLNAYGYVPVAGEDPYVVGAYVTGDRVNGIRNYALDHNPLNYSDVAYDVTGAEPHADGEVWNGVNFEVRQAMIDAYDRSFPYANAALQTSCANGQTPVDQCPGNRRWIQLMYDAWLLMPRAPSMVDARDAMLAADMTRFGGANQATIWAAFARRGLGVGAASNTGNDPQPTPSFASPLSSSPTVTFAPTTKGVPVANAQVFVGDYEARATPIADTDPATTTIGDAAPFVAGTYDLTVVAPGYGELRTTLTVRNGKPQTKMLKLGRNLASQTNGASATGDGTNLSSLIDDTEGTDWAFLGAPTDPSLPGTPVAGKSVTVHLDPSKASWQVQRVQVSAMLRPPNPTDPGGDTGSQNRFTALRQFQLLTCAVTKKVSCSGDADFTVAFTSPANAFPSTVPRPRAPELIMRSFSIPKTKATFVRLRVLTSQCTGAPQYAGDRDDDPSNVTDCSTGTPQAFNVRAAELQVFQK